MKQLVSKTLPNPGKPVSILDPAIPISDYCRIDLSTANWALKRVDLTDPVACEAYMDQLLADNGATVAYGGYLEKRNLYADKPAFTHGGNPRNIHLGVDFWAKAGTKVVAPLAGKVHSLRNNNTRGDYGPTVILQHEEEDAILYSLYGHLSLETLENLNPGQALKAGEVIGSLGTADINVNYAPHLHFQLIWDIGSYQGDYPGVCSVDELDYYQNNCPDPCFLLGI
ncbi:peptidoglycan DD-metalloendopeptidase family protein [Lentiprolixibacter aurantiacus]|uniref:Peptidoglycan DD-metalloendopeptidase family protein n=1 Tax=Lentiprolixibacter aurantiacus TaxID=2993939 RepID=A0AAE3MP65_9FLAO|nr:peptidoglycan DD-metalloendopeptidase family protein [Lentiprolixibacter aurantiacus]MCX2720442.1 peptidoglycan DD-metalloendopeptidase family protein [Lentiprolixibacter aurantiacus]